MPTVAIRKDEPAEPDAVAESWPECGKWFPFGPEGIPGKCPNCGRRLRRKPAD
jgi:hypothetical protein